MFIKAAHCVPGTRLSALYTLCPCVHLPLFNPHNKPMYAQLFPRVDRGDEANGGLAVPSHSLPLSLKPTNTSSGEDFLKL